MHNHDELSQAADGDTSLSMSEWRPLHERITRIGRKSAPLEVELHLQRLLREWVEHYLRAGGHSLRVALRLQVALPVGAEPYRYLAHQLPDSLLLTVTDAALAFHPLVVRGQTTLTLTRSAQGTGDALHGDFTRRVLHPLRQLQWLLVEAGSSWKVDPSGRALGPRVLLEVEHAHQATVHSAAIHGHQRAAHQLQRAWKLLFAARPEVAQAYRMAVTAVETAAVAVVIPDQPYASLEVVRAHLIHTSDQWTTSLGSGIDLVAAMMSELWIGTSAGHLKQSDLDDVTREATEQALLLATTLVSWFTGGHVIRRAYNR